MAERREHLSVIVGFLTDEEIIERLKRIDGVCNEIETFHHEYDYKDVPCNGFRTFVKVFGMYLAGLATDLTGGRVTGDQRLLQDYSLVSELLCINSQAALLIRGKGVNYPLQCTDMDCNIFHLFARIQARHVEPMYGSIGPFYIKTGFREQALQTLSTVHFMIAPMLEKVKFLMISRYRSMYQARNAVTMTLPVVKAMRSLDQFPLNLLMRWVIKPIDCTADWTTVPRDLNEWDIHVPGVKEAAVIRKKGSQVGATNQPPIPCMLIKPKAGSQSAGCKSKSLVIHFPSGGMIVALANIYTTFMSQVSRDLGVPVLVPKYSLSPEDPYPAAIQDALDLYMFFTSGDPQVTDLLGFHPDRVLLSGDSAGGYLVVTLTIALNEIRKLGGGVRMPTGLALQYPAMTMGFTAWPGMSMCGLDILTGVGEMRFAVAAYTPVHPPIDFTRYPIMSGDDNIDEVMKRFNDRMKDPLHTPLTYRFFDDMRDIPVNVLICEMDCMVDHGIDIAKKWPGPVTLDVGWGLPHGFPVGDESPATAADNRLLIQRLAAILQINFP